MNIEELGFAAMNKRITCDVYSDLMKKFSPGDCDRELKKRKKGLSELDDLKRKMMQENING